MSEGRVVFTAAQAQEALGIGAVALIEAALRQQKRKRFISPRPGFYVIVPPRYQDRGAPPPDWYIDALMAYWNRPYYVGLLTAAHLHGASHGAAMEFQAMEFQVITDRQLGPIRGGRYQLVFRYRTNMEGVAPGTQRRDTDTGHMRVSGAELTALDLLSYPNGAEGVDPIAIALVDLARRIDPDRLAALSGAFERPVAQRLGHLLERLGYRGRTAALHDALTRGGEMYWVEFDPLAGVDREISSGKSERDERWRVKVRCPPEAEN